MTLFEAGLIAHLVADWLLQNDWMARHKTDITHPAAWLHAAIHAVLLGGVLGLTAGVGLGIAHLVVDTRRPLSLWQHFFKQTTDGCDARMVAVWADQVLHLVCLAIAVLILERG